MIAGRYTLDAEIGRGGMGVVWRGTDTLLDREVALKRIGWLPGADAPDVARAAREARLAASLNHAHVVAVFDLVSHQDQQWLVMEYVKSRNLAQLVQERGPLPVHEAAALLGQAADALAAAHRAGIVHRDVKPSNILVTDSGQVKLTDFGIARAAGDATLTQTGMVTGSPAYLAPEVATGSPATPASDVWSLGATLFHAVAGHPPYDVRASVVTALYRIVHEEPPRPAGAGPLLPLLEVTMAREPERRLPMPAVRDRLLQAAVTEDRTLRVPAGSSPTAVLPVAGHEPSRDATLADRTSVAPAAASAPTRSAVSAAPSVKPASGTPSPGAVSPGAASPGAPSPGARSASLGSSHTAAMDPTHPGSALARPAEPPLPPARPAAPEPGRRRRPVRVAATLATTAVVALSGLVLAARGLDDDAGATAGDAPAGAASSEPSPTSARSSAPQDADRAPTAAALTGFVRSYLATVTTDPAAAWNRLTPGFQAASGGYDSYATFWDGIGSARLLGASADPADLTVSYTVQYRKRSGERLTDRVTLLLERDGDGFRIAGER